MQNAIGVFDSGLGGLSVLNSAATLLPNEQFIYVADSLHAPFGNKSDEFILKRCQVICEFLIKQNVKCILLACNTATLACVVTLRAQFDVPIVAIEPGLKPAVIKSQTKKILMLATQSTLQSNNYQSLRNTHASDCEIFEQACNGWVELVESGHSLLETNNLNLKVIKQYLSDIPKNGIDQIVLGCTHYPFLKPLIIKCIKQSQYENNISIVDTSNAVANHLKTILLTHKLLKPNVKHSIKQLTLYSSALKVDENLLNSLCQLSVDFKGQFES
ncbi:MAG: glutamate racemase [Saccharospirillaceae bacterium]|nr:glutamate racemase [Pseudomonadales bacterium]NRB80849.1 glutamate racemase [Saccharospirillaceae bacterium]